MKAVWWIIGGLVVLLLVVWLMGQDSTDRATNTTPSASQSTSSGQYLTYTGDLSIGTGRRLLFFHAPWCPQCRALEATILAEGVPEGVTIIKVDYDANQSLRQEYGVTIQTTLVEIDAAGKLVERYVAYEEPSIAAVSGHFSLE